MFVGLCIFVYMCVYICVCKCICVCVCVCVLHRKTLNDEFEFLTSDVC